MTPVRPRAARQLPLSAGLALVSGAMNAPPPLSSTTSPPSSARATRSAMQARSRPTSSSRATSSTGATPLVLRPGSVAEVAAILKLANETRTPIVPAGRQYRPRRRADPVRRRRRDRRVAVAAEPHPRGRSRQQHDDGRGRRDRLPTRSAAADAADRLFPLSLASEGSCQIGGNLSTNAGGTAVLAYGNDARTGARRRGGAALRAKSGTASARSARTTPATTSRTSSSAPRARSASSPAAVLKLFPQPRGVSVAFVGVAEPGGGAGALQHRAEPRRQRADRLRADAAHRHRDGAATSCRARAIRSPARTPGTCCSRFRRRGREADADATDRGDLRRRARTKGVVEDGARAAIARAGGGLLAHPPRAVGGAEASRAARSSTTSPCRWRRCRNCIAARRARR